MKLPSDPAARAAAKWNRLLRRLTKQVNTLVATMPQHVLAGPVPREVSQSMRAMLANLEDLGEELRVGKEQMRKLLEGETEERWHPGQKFRGDACQ